MWQWCHCQSALPVASPRLPPWHPPTRSAASARCTSTTGSCRRSTLCTTLSLAPCLHGSRPRLRRWCLRTRCRQRRSTRCLHQRLQRPHPQPQPGRLQMTLALWVPPCRPPQRCQRYHHRHHHPCHPRHLSRRHLPRFPPRPCRRMQGGGREEHVQSGT